MTFTSMCNSFIIDVIKRVIPAIAKHNIEMRITFDGVQEFELRSIIENLIK
jgi:hypothetical protein